MTNLLVADRDIPVLSPAREVLGAEETDENLVTAVSSPLTLL
jgi:hypothetical protein